jgi:hypothetical protein
MRGGGRATIGLWTFTCRPMQVAAQQCHPSAQRRPRTGRGCCSSLEHVGRVPLRHIDMFGARICGWKDKLVRLPAADLTPCSAPTAPSCPFRFVAGHTGEDAAAAGDSDEHAAAEVSDQPAASLHSTQCHMHGVPHAAHFNVSRGGGGGDASAMTCMHLALTS